MTATAPLSTQPDSPWLEGSLWHAWSEEDFIPDVNQLYADLEHAKANTIEAYLDSEVGSDEDNADERAKLATRLGWRFGTSTWTLALMDRPGMAGDLPVYICERHVLAKPQPAQS